MTMTPAVAALRIANDLHQFEALLAETLALAGKLSATMTGARAELKVAPTVGHKTLLYIARAQSALLNANADTARLHASLRHDAAEVGIVYEETTKTGILQSGNTVAAAA